MATFIHNPEIVEAVKWDGSVEGAAEVRALLEKAGYTLADFSMVYDSDGKPKKGSGIRYFKGSRWPARDDSDKYLMADFGSWVVYKPGQHNSVEVKNHTFDSNYTELTVITPEVIEAWVERGKNPPLEAW